MKYQCQKIIPITIITFMLIASCVNQNSQQQNQISNAQIKDNILNIINNKKIKKPYSINIDVSAPTALISGYVNSNKDKNKIYSIVNNNQQINKIINLLKLKNKTSQQNQINDQKITNKLKLHISFDELIEKNNYAYRVINAEVYILGSANSFEESQLVINHAETIPEIKSIISLINIKK